MTGQNEDFDGGGGGDYPRRLTPLGGEEDKIEDAGDEQTRQNVSAAPSTAPNTLNYPIVTEGRRTNSRRSTDYQRTLSARKEPLTQTLKRKTKTFFGVEDDDDEDVDQYDLWTDRRIRLASRRYGGLRDEVLDHLSARDAFKSLPPGSGDAPDSAMPMQRDLSTLPSRRKPTVADYTKEGLTTLRRKLSKTQRKPSHPRSKSYLPSQAAAEDVGMEMEPREDEMFYDKDGTRVPKSKYMYGELKGDDDKVDGPGLARISRVQLGEMEDNSDRRVYGVGVVGNVFQRSLRQSVRRRRTVREQMDEMEDYRPYFTYWVTSVQIIIMVFSMIVYGLGAFGVGLNQSSGLVLTSGLTLEQVDILEPANFWWGPRAADLIHLGAKFSPCMRKDEKIIREIQAQRDFEANFTGCCVRNDHSGCVQTTKEQCSPLLSTFYKWSVFTPGPDRRVSGPVCGQDPQYCTAPASRAPYTWPDDIRQWPVCRAEPDTAALLGVPGHMTCELVARPCCVGIHGKCELMTAEHCSWVHGHFHPEATLCSQVSCMEDVCGMLPFVSALVPDQFYRLWTSLFLHAGIIHLLITMIVQWVFMRDLEKMCGPLRMAVIYLGSGITGNLASAIFVPYRAESGPAGSQFGLLAALIVEIINSWPMLRSPCRALANLLVVTGVLFLIGLLPWVDNYAHLFGFISGFVLSYAFLPYISFNTSSYNKKLRLSLIIVCIVSYILLFTILIVVFYVTPIYDCEICRYLSCIPFTTDFCADQNIDFAKDKPIVNF